MLSREREEQIRGLIANDFNILSVNVPRELLAEVDRLRTVMADMADELGSYISAGRINCVGADNVVAGLRYAAKAAGGE